MGVSNHVDGVFVSGSYRKIAVNDRIDWAVKNHFGSVRRRGACVSLVGYGKKTFRRHLKEHINFGCNVNKFIYVDNIQKVVSNLRRSKRELCPDSDMKIVKDDIINVLRDMISQRRKISVLDHDGTSNYNEVTEEAIELGAKAGADIMICTVSSRMNDLSPFLINGWKKYNNCKKECNYAHHKPDYQRGVRSTSWPPVLCNKSKHYKHKPSMPVRNIQTFMMIKKAKELGYKFTPFPYTGGDGKGIPMMVGLFLKK